MVLPVHLRVTVQPPTLINMRDPSERTANEDKRIVVLMLNDCSTKTKLTQNNCSKEAHNSRSIRAVFGKVTGPLYSWRAT